MTQLNLSDEQTRLVWGSSLPIVVFDSLGQKVGEIAPVARPEFEVNSMSDEQWVAEALRRRVDARRDGAVGSTTQEVLARLRAIKPE